jgi:hypothetical protein
MEPGRPSAMKLFGAVLHALHTYRATKRAHRRDESAWVKAQCHYAHLVACDELEDTIREIIREEQHEFPRDDG